MIELLPNMINMTAVTKKKKKNEKEKGDDKK